MKRVVLAMALLGGVVVACALYNLAAVAVLKHRYPPLGRMYTVDGHAMHLYCTGSGPPTIVLEAGLGDDLIYWQKVQPEIAKTTRVCSYDRAGIGWSEDQPGARDAKHIAQQLHALLQGARVAPPLVLVGASAGGFYVRQFTADYPQEVVGIVFVDSSVPEQVRALPYGAWTQEKARKMHRDALWDLVRQSTGWARLTGKCTGDVEKGLESYAGQVRAEACRPAYARAGLGEWDEFWTSAQQAAEAKCCGTIPLLIISQDPARPKPGWDAQSIAAQPIWNDLQESLKALSPASRRIIARGSAHHVMIDRPDVVINGIREMVTDIREQTPDPQVGTTTVQ